MIQTGEKIYILCFHNKDNSTWEHVGFDSYDKAVTCAKLELWSELVNYDEKADASLQETISVTPCTKEGEPTVCRWNVQTTEEPGEVRYYIKMYEAA